MASSGVTVETRDVQQALDRFTQRVRDKVQRRAHRLVAAPIESDMRAGVPQDEGALEQAIGKRTKINRGEGSVVTVVGPFKKTVNTVRGSTKKRSQMYKANFFEEGTQYMSKRPFVSRAYKQNERNIPQAFERALREAVEREL